jgi:alkylated DNA repair dioxygenase AlkB
MEQLSFFADAGHTPGLPTEVLEYHPSIFNTQESADFLRDLIAHIPWEQKTMSIYGKLVITPRLTAWYGNPEKTYAYSGNSFHPLPWTDELLIIKRRVEPFAGITFNSVLLNYYRDGNDSVAWHSDNERELGRQPIIGSVSFGQVRQFDIRHKDDHAKKYGVKLENGSLLLMKGDLQQNWQHRIAKSVKPMGPRINLTFRVIKEHNA